MSLVAEKPKKPKKAKVEVEGDGEKAIESWVVFARLDPSLKERFDSYVNSQKYPPRLGQVFEQMMREFLEKEGF